MPYSQQRYERALEIINNGFAAFHKVGAKAYDPSLDTSRMLDDAFGQPSGKFRSIHIAGTNGAHTCGNTKLRRIPDRVVHLASYCGLP